MLAPWKKSYDQARQHIKKQSHYIANKGPSSQSYGFSNSHVWMWELNYKESLFFCFWAQKNWCFWTVVLEKTLESPLDCKEIQPVNSEVNQSWTFIGRNDADVETPVLWPPDAKSWLIWKDPDAGKHWGQEEKGTTQNEVVRWHHHLNGHGFGWTPEAGDGQAGLVSCSSWVAKSQTRMSNWTAITKVSITPWLQFPGGCIAHVLSYVQLFAAPWTAARQVSLSFTISQSLLKLKSIVSAMPSNCLILYCPLLLLSSIFPSIRVFFNESTLRTSGGQSIGASALASVLPMSIKGWFPLGLISLISLQSKGLSRVFSSTTVQKHQFFDAQPSLWPSSHVHALGLICLGLI